MRCLYQRGAGQREGEATMGGSDAQRDHATKRDSRKQANDEAGIVYIKCRKMMAGVNERERVLWECAVGRRRLSFAVDMQNCLC